MKKKTVILISAFVVLIGIVIGVLLAFSTKSLNGKEFFCDINEYERYTLEFTKDTVVVEHLQYRADSKSPSGKILDSSKTTTETYNYKIIEKGIMECDGKTYEFEEREIIKLTSWSTSEKYDGLVFDSRFLGITDEWRLWD